MVATLRPQNRLMIKPIGSRLVMPPDKVKTAARIAGETAHWYAHNPEEQDEFTQVALFRIFLMYPRHDPARSFDGFCKRVSENALKNELRKIQQERKAGRNVTDLRINLKRQASREKPPDDLVMQRDAVDYAERRLGQFRQTVVGPLVAYVHGASYKEIAERMQLDLGVLKRKIFEIREFLLSFPSLKDISEI